MAIPVTTRSGKGSPLTQAEMDTNLTNLARSATEIAEGNIEIATQAEVDGNTDDLAAVTALKLAGGLDKTIASTGELTLPSWMGSLIVKWGETTTTGAATAVTFSTAFPNQMFGAVVTPQENFAPGAETASVTSATTTGFDIIGYLNNNGQAIGDVFWIAIGY